MIEKMIHVSVSAKPQTPRLLDFMELYFVLRGKAIGSANNRELPLKTGDLWLANYGVVHSLEQCSENCVYVSVNLNMRLFDAYLPNISKTYFKCGPEEHDIASENYKREIKSDLYRLIMLMREQGFVPQREQEVLYTCINILSTLRMGFNMINRKPSDGQDEQFDRVWRILDYIYDHCNRKLTLKEAAEQEHISETHLSRVLKETTGKNFEESLALIRAECSIKYLIESDLSLTDIAYECGFSALRYYTAAFQRYYNCTPREYRKKAKGVLQRIPDHNAAVLTLEDDTEWETLRSLIEPYNKDFSTEWEINQITVDLGLLNTHGQKRNPFQTEVLRCAEEAILSYKSASCLQECRETLGIHKLCVPKFSSQNNKRIAQQNAEHIGFELVDQGVFVALEDLYVNMAQRTIYFYRQKLLRQIKPPLLILKNETVCCKVDDTIVLLLFPIGDKPQKRVSLRFRNLSPQGPYLVKRENIGVSATEEGKSFKKAALQPMMNEEGLPIFSLRQEIYESLEEKVVEESICQGQIRRITLMPISEK